MYARTHTKYTAGLFWNGFKFLQNKTIKNCISCGFLFSKTISRKKINFKP